jgi:hypothetical protein
LRRHIELSGNRPYVAVYRAEHAVRDVRETVAMTNMFASTSPFTLFDYFRLPYELGGDAEEGLSAIALARPRFSERRPLWPIDEWRVVGPIEDEGQVEFAVPGHPYA